MLKTLKKLLGIKEPKQLSHPFFCELQFISFKNPSQGYWEGEMVIEDNSIVSIAINASENGPELAHEQFWKNMTSNFDAILEKCFDTMKREYEEWTGKVFPDNYSNELSWDGLTIPRNGDENNEWDITFGFADDPDHALTIYFQNGKAITASVDG